MKTNDKHCSHIFAFLSHSQCYLFIKVTCLDILLTNAMLFIDLCDLNTSLDHCM